MLVRALSQGYYKGRHIDSGSLFEIDPKDFAGKDNPDPIRASCAWMEKYVEPTPEPKPKVKSHGESKES
jgi:hypothetical protein